MKGKKQMTSQVVKTNNNPGCLVQILWFALIGIWLGEIWMAVAWFLMITIIGIPFGVVMLNKIPKVIALREAERQVKYTYRNNGIVEKQALETEQVNIILRSLYFILIGWWFSALWMQAAYALCVSIIGLPLGFWMFDRVPAVLSLHRD
jgi:uncharacterized membrane protein YccF (DUF307 family)